jgi:hypothetical protein
MASASPYAAILGRLQAMWTTTPIIEVDGNTQVTLPTDSDGFPVAWVGIEFPGGAAEQWSIGDPGNNAWREDGAFMIHISVPVGAGKALALNYADQLAAIFRGKKFSFVTCWAPNPPQFNGIDGNYCGYSFGTPYHYEYRA